MYFCHRNSIDCLGSLLYEKVAPNSAAYMVLIRQNHTTEAIVGWISPQELYEKWLFAALHVLHGKIDKNQGGKLYSTLTTIALFDETCVVYILVAVRGPLFTKP